MNTLSCVAVDAKSFVSARTLSHPPFHIPIQLPNNPTADWLGIWDVIAWSPQPKEHVRPAAIGAARAGVAHSYHLPLLPRPLQEANPRRCLDRLAWQPSKQNGKSLLSEQLPFSEKASFQMTVNRQKKIA